MISRAATHGFFASLSLEAVLMMNFRASFKKKLVAALANFIIDHYLNSLLSNYLKNQLMKSAIKKLSALNKATIVRSLFFSFVFIVFYMLVLYVLINSPA